MHSDYEPIVITTPRVFDYIELYFLHDLHKGAAEHDDKKWERMKQRILSGPNRYAVLIGDAMENAVPNSKSDIFTQTIPPFEQKEWVAEQITDLKDRLFCIVDGNHEKNRTTKLCGLYPLYDCCVRAGIESRYRPHFAFLDIAVGNSAKNSAKQVHYFGYCIHKARDTKAYSSADFIDGIDFAAYGHTHDPSSHPRAKLMYDSKNKTVSRKSVKVINGGSFMTYGGYAPDSGHRPLSDETYRLRLDGRFKEMENTEFQV